ncbi:hypothetical protein AZI86_02575 [Bdellovibrio bacteriovorus]|uniref:Uncharacterized protein n=1 Tax=Bdellovibrio bacteriovorus TaxID=959 RepID=A0A150WNC2_BDEBC|nr:hypothetical protein [Bdellovibrio bacteriovorus]KYG65972.1 hypothetical protein AZI86_02575 [Bdellovibrio bacteriovorus]
MKSSIKIFSSVLVLFIGSSVAWAELAGSKGNASGSWVAEFEKKKTGCPVRPKVDPKDIKTCPKVLGEIPLDMDQVSEFIVYEYRPDTETFSLVGVDLPDEGETIVTLEAIAKSDATLSDNKGGEKMAVLKKALTNPCDLLKRRFKIKKIATLSDAEIKARKSCVRK